MEGPRASVAQLPLMKPCVLVGERQDRTQFEALAAADFSPWHTSIGSIVFQRPDGWVMVDPAFGHTIDEDLKRSPPWFGIVMGTAQGKTPVLALLENAGISYRDVKYVLVTHSHWDHVGGLRDLTASSILLPRTELEHARSQKKYLDHGIMKHQLEVKGARFQPFEFDGPPYEGFSSSHDVFRDGTVVAVPLPGHTPGSAGYFLNSGDGKRFLLVGDAVWSYEGIKRPAHKNPLASAIVDYDQPALAETIGRLHTLAEERPDLVIVPAHDGDQAAKVGECPERSR